MLQYQVKHFSPKEFTCHCCGNGLPALMLVLWLDMLRKAWGDVVLVNSGYRCPKHNAEVGGAKRSRHLLGCAADITTLNSTTDKAEFERFTAFVSRMAGTTPEGWEVIIYPQKRFIHVGIPRDEEGRKWAGGRILL